MSIINIFTIAHFDEVCPQVICKN